MLQDPLTHVSVSKVYLGKLYDENWNATWNISAEGTLDNLPSDYSTFNTTWFNSTTGMPCSTTDNSSSCYIDTATGVLWLRIQVTQIGAVVNATLVNANVTNNASVSGNSTLIMNATITGSESIITDGAVIKGDYGNSYLSNSSVGNATVVSSNLTSSTMSSNATVTNSTLTSATVSNSTLTNVTVSSTSIITNVASLNNITLAGVTVTGNANYEYEGVISGGTGWATYQSINFTKVYTDVHISQLVIEQSSNQNIASGANSTINDTSLETSMNFSMTVNLSRGML